jgi:hypothetical protein
MTLPLLQLTARSVVMEYRIPLTTSIRNISTFPNRFWMFQPAKSSTGNALGDAVYLVGFSVFDGEVAFSSWALVHSFYSTLRNGDPQIAETIQGCSIYRGILLGNQ